MSLALLASPAMAEQYTAPGLGMVTVDVPAKWRVKERPGPTSLYVELRPPEGDDTLTLQLTSTWLVPDKLAELRRTLKERVERTAKGLLANATETEAPLTELTGSGGAGYYFALTGRSPESDNSYRYLTQGMLVTNVGLTVFTLLQREASPVQRQQVLAMMAAATYAKDNEASTTGNQGDALRVIPQEASYQLWLPASRLYMDVPKGRLVPAPDAGMAATNNPRYFHFVDRGLNISGWFEPAKKFAGVQAFWASETAAWKKSELPDAVDVSFKQINGWDTIIYDLPIPTGANSHIRAHWLQAGTWIDLHISLTANRSSAELREALEGFLKGVLVRERP